MSDDNVENMKISSLSPIYLHNKMFFKTILFQGSAAIDDGRMKKKHFAKSNVKRFNQKLDKNEIFSVILKA